jgi:NAD(P)-dependent dehydrogenase (short-subunit alcohol dehydrogenase family)
LKLQGKVTVITGAAGLLGREFTRAVLTEGSYVGLIDNDSEALSTFSAEMEQEFPGKTLALLTDIVSQKEVQVAADLIISKWGKINGLVNNAMLNPKVENSKKGFRKIEDVSYQDWSSEMNVGLFGTFNCTRIFGQHILKNVEGGSIVNISSEYGHLAPNHSLYNEAEDSEWEYFKPITYSVIKHGVVGMARYFATYWGRFGIRVNVLSPSGIEAEQPENFRKAYISQVPLGRMSTTLDYKGPIIFLLSEESKFMNGANLIIDGGKSIW